MTKINTNTMSSFSVQDCAPIEVETTITGPECILSEQLILGRLARNTIVKSFSIPSRQQ